MSVVLVLICLGYAAAQQAATPAVSNYAPAFTACPAGTPLVRPAGTPAQGNQTLSNSENAFRQRRREVTRPLWRDYLETGTGKGTGYDASALTSDASELPTIALAHSGGGYRAALYAAGVQQAFDSRNQSSPVAGVLQLMMYQAGLSGGSWYLSSAVLNGYPTVPQLVQGSNPGWKLDMGLLNPDGNSGVIANSKYYSDLFGDVDERAAAGFNVSITDIWGRALAYHLLPGTTADNFFQDNVGTAHGAGILFSSIVSLPAFSNYSIPFPIITACQRPPMGQGSNTSSTTVIPLGTTVFEFNPYEFGSYDPYLSAFTPVQYLGTYVNSGTAYVPAFVNRTAASVAAGDCVVGFDQASFVYGTSASLFNAMTATVRAALSSTDVEIIDSIVSRLSSELRASQVDIANYPNSFRGVSGPQGFDRTDDVGLELVDGGENGENVPLGPLLIPARVMDVIIAADASADTAQSQGRNGAGWPNGTSLITTYNRTTQLLTQGSQLFPSIPLQQSVWVDQGYNQRPTFFGCENASSAGASRSPPLVIYLPNAPAAQTGYYTNVSTFALQYSNDDVGSFLTQATASVAGGFVVDGARDSQWPTCLACALVDRTRAAKGISRSSVCSDCFQKYCYSPGQTGLTVPSGAVAPSSTNSGASRAITMSALAMGAAFATLCFV